VPASKQRRPATRFDYESWLDIKQLEDWIRTSIDVDQRGNPTARNEKPRVLARKPRKPDNPIREASPRLLAMMGRDAARRNFEGVDVDQLCRRLGTSKIARRAIDAAKPYRPLQITMTPERWLNDFDAIVAWLKRQRSKPPISPAEKRKRLQQAASALAKAEFLSKLAGCVSGCVNPHKGGVIATKGADRPL